MKAKKKLALLISWLLLFWVFLIYFPIIAVTCLVGATIFIYSVIFNIISEIINLEKEKF